jgi:aminoglycoside 6'-N-acetyltransferase I
MTLQVRLASKLDVKIWATMRLALWPHSNLKALTQELATLLKNPKFQGWIAESDGEAVGFAEAYVRDFANGCDSQPVAFLEGVWVAPGSRHKGVGRRLIRAVEAWALKRGLKELGSDAQLGARLSHRSHLGWGFEETERVVYFRKKLKRRAKT